MSQANCRRIKDFDDFGAFFDMILGLKESTQSSFGLKSLQVKEENFLSVCRVFFVQIDSAFSESEPESLGICLLFYYVIDLGL